MSGGWHSWHAYCAGIGGPGNGCEWRLRPPAVGLLQTGSTPVVQEDDQQVDGIWRVEYGVWDMGYTCFDEASKVGADDLASVMS